MSDRWKVTFYNPLAERRGVAVDNITLNDAMQVAQKLSDPTDPNWYLPDVEIEEQQPAEVTA